MKARVSVLLAVVLLGSFGASSASAQKKSNQNIRPCKDHPGFSNTTLTVVIFVKPADGDAWTFAEAPSVVAQRMLSDLNANRRGIVFQEANGVSPYVYIEVTLIESNDGTRRDSANAFVNMMGPFSFNEVSGQAPYTGWRDAVDHLSTNMLLGFQNGWRSGTPCREADGSIRR